ncbi:MAG: hydantoinase/oxoprolinase family protein [Geminicoccaceae bacterium]
MTRRMFRLGCDIGGTFTDFLLLDEESGELTSLKRLTTPDDPSIAVADGIAELADAHPGLLDDLESIIHGTTLVINAVIERKGAKTALITTEGFRDILELRREIRYDIYDIRQRFPKPLVERRHRHEVRERIMANGSIRTPLDEESARTLLIDLKRLGFEAVAVCLLHAYANPIHEKRLEAIATEVAAELDLSLSADVLPEMQEFERTATTVVNAYVRPIVDRYLARLEERLHDQGYRRSLFLMLSGGGIVGATEAAKVPVRLAESGPVGGAIATRALGETAGIDTLLAFDMGGTTAKACLIDQGSLPITRQYEVDRVHRFKRGSGTPIAVPTVDLIEIGAGGGSIVSIDVLGRLQVGPESAGADPGPACYGQGGRRATVTDADLVLGYLGSDSFMDGRLPLDAAAASAAIISDVGQPLGLDKISAAAAIAEVVDENMAQAARMYAAEHGGDLTRASMVAFGGAGPLHADRVARKLGLRQLIVPGAAGVFSALGFLAAPVAFEVSRTHVLRLGESSEALLAEIFAELGIEARRVVEKASPEATIGIERNLDMAYAGQGHQLRVSIDSFAPDDIARRFADAYRQAYGYAYDDLEPQIVTLRTVATSTQPTASIDRPAGRPVEGPSSPAPSRNAYCPITKAMIEHQVIPFDAMSGTALGPLLLEQTGSTVRVGTGATASLDDRGWLVIELGDSP